MKYVLSALEMQESDKYTINLGTKALTLMERAGQGIFNDLKNLLSKEDKILIVCGSGGNGGDGYVIARYLYEENYDVSVLKVGNHFNDECQINYDRYKGKIFDSIDDFSTFTCIIDSIFGVGLNKNIEGKYFEIISKLNKTSALKISVDIPSGLDATSGKVLGICFKANYVYTIQNYKLGLFLNESRNYYDHLKLIDIGIVSKDYSSFVKLFEKEDYKILFKKREKVSNKGSYGKVALIGGSKLLMGALLLSANALAALRMGVGYSTVCVPESLHHLYALKNLENTYLLFKDQDGQILFDKENLDKLLKYDVITIGMGIGTSKEVYKIISYLLNNFKNTLIIDADGLNSISRYGVDILKNHECNVILTPHLKEFSRLINKEISEFKDNIIEEVKSFSKKYNLITNCKSNISVISDGISVNLNTTGNPSLAKGGSGDVLSGITSGVVSNNKDNLFLAVSAGAYILGKAADEAIKTLNENSVISSDIVSKISDVLNYITK